MKPDVYSHSTKPNLKEPLIKGAVSLPLSSIKRSAIIPSGSEEDKDVCLNCTLPPNRCYGNDKCYLKHKKIKDGGESDGEQRTKV